MAEYEMLPGVGIQGGGGGGGGVYANPFQGAPPARRQPVPTYAVVHPSDPSKDLESLSALTISRTDTCNNPFFPTPQEFSSGLVGVPQQDSDDDAYEEPDPTYAVATATEAPENDYEHLWPEGAPPQHIPTAPLPGRPRHAAAAAGVPGTPGTYDIATAEEIESMYATPRRKSGDQNVPAPRQARPAPGVVATGGGRRGNGVAVPPPLPADNGKRGKKKRREGPADQGIIREEFRNLSAFRANIRFQIKATASHADGPAFVIEEQELTPLDITDLVAEMNHSALKRISMYKCSIGDHGANMIGLALRTNSQLKSLSLTSCGINDQGAVAMAASLRKNYTLEFLSLAGNKIADDGIIALVQATHLVFGLGEYNLVLKELHLQKNKNSKKTKKALVRDIPDDGHCHVKF